MDKKVYKNERDICTKKLEYCLDEPEHTHEFIELVYISHGSATHYINGTSYEVRKGDMLFINYKQTHSFVAHENLNYYNVSIKPKLFSEELINSENAFELLSLSAFEDFRQEVNPEGPLVTFDGNEIIKVEFVLDEMEREENGDNLGKNILIKSYLTVLLAYIFRKMASANSEDKGQYNHIPAEILEYIANHCNEKITLYDLAERSFYNPCYFSRLFKEIYGMTVSDYIQKVRIEKSCFYLKHSKLTVDEISGMVGYEDKTNFYKFFKKHCGMTPAAYRKARR